MGNEKEVKWEKQERTSLYKTFKDLVSYYFAMPKDIITFNNIPLIDRDVVDFVAPYQELINCASASIQQTEKKGKEATLF